MPDGEGGERGQAPERLHVQVAVRPPTGPGDDQVAHHLFLDDHGEADFAGHGAARRRQRVGAPAPRGRGFRAREDARHGAARIRSGDRGDVRPGQLDGRGGDPGEGRPDVARVPERASRGLQRVELAPGAGEGVVGNGRRVVHAQALFRPRRSI